MGPKIGFLRDIGLMQDTPPATKVLIITACSPGETAHELPDVGHGMLTCAFVKLLEARGDKPLYWPELLTEPNERMSAAATEHTLPLQHVWVQGPTSFPALVDAADSLERRALFVGVDSYADSTIANLACAENDARSLSECLGKAGYEGRLLCGKDATLNAIRAELRDLADSMTDDTLVLLTFSGHGMTEPNDRHALVVHDTARKDGIGLGNTLALDEITAIFRNRSGAVALILDTHFELCRSCR